MHSKISESQFASVHTRKSRKGMVVRGLASEVSLIKTRSTKIKLVASSNNNAHDQFGQAKLGPL